MTYKVISSTIRARGGGRYQLASSLAISMYIWRVKVQVREGAGPVTQYYLINLVRTLGVHPHILIYFHGRCLTLQVGS